jgi:molybdenum cofactor cytidylyltransferase
MPVVIVLAAGRGERFKASGGQSHKLQSLLQGQAVLDRTLAAVTASGLPYQLVTPALVRAFLLQQAPAEPSEREPGMGDSIAAGVAACPDADGWLILPGDLPLVQSSSIQTIAAALRAYPQAAPVFKGQRGHPVGFAAGHAAALMSLRGEQGAGKLLKLATLQLCNVDDPGCVRDVDTTQDLQALEAMLSKT